MTAEPFAYERGFARTEEEAKEFACVRLLEFLKDRQIGIAVKIMTDDEEPERYSEFKAAELVQELWKKAQPERWEKMG